MPPPSPTFLSYLDNKSTVSDSKNFIYMMKDYLELYYSDLDFCIIKHIYAPVCYIPEYGNDNDTKYLELLNRENQKPYSEFGEFLKSDNLLISPLTDYTNKVKYLLAFDACPGDRFDELSVVIRDIKEIFRTISAHTEESSRSLNMNMVNLVSRISHDLNSLIALIPKETAKEEALSARIKYSEVMSREIMLYLRELSIDKSNVPVRDLFTGITSVIFIPENVDLRLKFIDEIEPLTVDVELIDKALSAILSNAVYATSIEGGEVKMIVGKRKKISPFIKFNWLEIIISDTGPGITREFLTEIRKPFFTTWKDQGHVGLGLSIAEKIIRAHDGSLDIKSTQEKGTMVTIYLPLC